MRINSSYGINALLLRKELEHITAHPDQWRQGVWIGLSQTSSCGTVACLAGNTVLHAGWQPSTRYGELYLLDTLPSSGPQFEFVRRDDRVAEVRAAAREELNLLPWEATLLFDGSASLVGLWIIASLLTEGEVEVPESIVRRADEGQRTYASEVQRFTDVVTAVRKLHGG